MKSRFKAAWIQGAVRVICLASPVGPEAWVRQAISPFERDCRLLRRVNSVSKIDMHPRGEHHQFASDNTAGICREVLSGVGEAHRGGTVSSGHDEWTNWCRGW